MRLAAIYISEHYFLFDEPQTINLGGKNIYKFHLNEKSEIEISFEENSNYIPDFFGKDISLVSAIVGENGVGKTSLLKEIILTFERFRDENYFNNVVFVYEFDDNSIKVKTKLKISNDKLLFEPSKTKVLYYSPILDYDLVDIVSPINPSSKFKSTLSDYHLDCLENQMIFNYSETSVELKKIHKDDFPRFDNILIKANLLYLDDFKKKHVLIDNKKKMIGFLEAISLKYPNNSDNKQFIHFQDDIIKNIECSILMILAVNDKYLEDLGFGEPKFNTNEILEGEDFLEIFNRFKINRISSNSTPEIFNKYLDLGDKKFKKFINESEKTTSNQFLSLLWIIELFECFENFYYGLNSAFFNNIFEKYERNLLFSNIENSKNKIESMIEFIQLYRNLKKVLNRLQVPDYSLLEFSFFNKKNEKKIRFSTGEKALLNLYSIIYDYVLNSQNDHHKFENYILLLDEADLGYHPEWKKKFVNSCLSVLPKILNEITSFKKLQIIFTTHDPLTLSDIPNSNITYIKRVENETKFLDFNSKPQKSFGANITDLLSDSFFFGNEDKALIGDFAKEKINEVIKFLKKEDSKIKTKEEAKQIIEIIDEPLVKYKLKEMYFKNYIDSDYIDAEIERLNNLKIRNNGKY